MVNKGKLYESVMMESFILIEFEGHKEELEDFFSRSFLKVFQKKGNSLKNLNKFSTFPL